MVPTTLHLNSPFPVNEPILPVLAPRPPSANSSCSCSYHFFLIVSSSGLPSRRPPLHLPSITSQHPSPSPDLQHTTEAPSTCPWTPNPGPWTPIPHRNIQGVRGSWLGHRILIPGTFSQDRNTQQPRGFGFVTFMDPVVAIEVASQKQVCMHENVYIYISFSQYSGCGV